jgi:hypothetical protein
MRSGLAAGHFLTAGGGQKRVGPESASVPHMDDPTDIAVVEDLQQLLGMRVGIVTSTTAKIPRAILRLYSTRPAELVDPSAPTGVLIGLVRDQEIVDLAVKALGIRALPPNWQ